MFWPGKSQMESHFQWLLQNFCQLVGGQGRWARHGAGPGSGPEKNGSRKLKCCWELQKFAACHCHFCFAPRLRWRRIRAFYSRPKPVNSKPSAQNRTTKPNPITAETAKATAKLPATGDFSSHWNFAAIVRFWCCLSCKSPAQREQPIKIMFGLTLKCENLLWGTCVKYI